MVIHPSAQNIIGKAIESIDRSGYYMVQFDDIREKEMHRIYMGVLKYLRHDYDVHYDYIIYSDRRLSIIIIAYARQL